jgi:AI-2 transport protein TqsA
MSYNYLYMNLKNTASFFVTAIAIVITLIYGQSLLIPFIFAVLLWFIIRKLKSILDKLSFVKQRVPSWLKSLVSATFVLAVLNVASKILLSSISSLAKSYETYTSNVTMILNKINEALNINLMDAIRGYSSNFDFGTILGSVFNSLTDIVSNSFMILLYALFIFLEESYFQTKLKAVFSKNEQYTQVIKILEKIETTISHYLGLKTLVSLITGVLSYTVLAIIGIDSPEFWAFLIFILNFIPTIGSLIGTTFPAVFSLLQFGEFTPCLLVLLFVGLIQILVGNILEPRLMGNSLNISSLVAIISLSFWGVIWGITGMILSIPITVIMIILCSQFEKSKPIAIMLSEKGEIG